MSDTIAAIATPQLPSAIGILRLSGPDTAAVLARVFRARGGALSPRKMVYGDLLDQNGEVIDHALCVSFPAPNSYTGEDCAELHCHGSPVVLNEGLTALFAAGCRQARGGEFTQRAFLNGRLDLIQAESVADLIDAETAEAAKNAVGQLDGAISRSIDGIYDGLMDIVSRFYAVVDYPDEDIEPLQQEQILRTLQTAQEKLTRLLATFSRGKLLKLGIPTVILGKPNAGKSSLLNALLGYDRAIVTDIAGTTRDTVEEKVRLGHTLLRLCDTAGIRQTADTVEQIGVDRARQAAEQAELALLVLDGSAPLSPEDAQAMDIARQARYVLVLVNKSDLPQTLDTAALTERFEHILPISAKDGTGLDRLTEAVCALYPAEKAAQGTLLTNARQADAVERALHAIQAAQEALAIGMTPDVVLTNAEEALEALGELNGKRVREDLVSTIFSRFCVGK